MQNVSACIDWGVVFIVKQEWEAYWDNYRYPNSFMRSDIEPFNNPVRVMVADLSRLGSSVLDVGCASCISYPLFEDVMDYVGVDFTPKLLKVGKKLEPSVMAVHGYALQLPFKDGAFDTAFIKDVLEHLGPEAYKTVIAEMWRVVKLQILLVFYQGLLDKTTFSQKREPDEHNIGVPPYKGLTYYFNRYGRQDIIDTITQLPQLNSYNIIENVPREISGDKTRTVVIVKKSKKEGKCCMRDS